MVRIWREKWRWHLREREGGREVFCWRREGGFNRSLWHGGCEMRWWNRRIGRREGEREGEREIVCQNVDVWRLGFHPAKWLKCSLWHSYSPIWNHAYVQRATREEVWSQHIGNDLSNSWRHNSGRRRLYFNIYRFNSFHLAYSNRSVIV